MTDVRDELRLGALGRFSRFPGGYQGSVRLLKSIIGVVELLERLDRLGAMDASLLGVLPRVAIMVELPFDRDHHVAAQRPGGDDGQDRKHRDLDDAIVAKKGERASVA